MIRGLFSFTVLLFLLPVVAVESVDKLPEKYIVSYGQPGVGIKIVKYYSFTCPHCVTLFRKDFVKIREEFVDEGLISYSFHPVPRDLVTICAMDCLAKLEGKKKTAFLEVMLEEVNIDDTEYSIGIMKKAMEILGAPIPNLGDRDYLVDTEAFKAAFEFISQDSGISAVPSVEVDGKLFEREIPDLEFLRTIVGKKRVALCKTPS